MLTQNGDEKSIMKMKSELTCHVPDVLSKEEIFSCLCVIKEGEAVNFKSAENELPQAMVVAIQRVGREIVGVGVIKRRRTEYATDIAVKSGFSFDHTMHELGYVAVKKSHRGNQYSHKITEKLLSSFQSRPIFATTSNPRMKETLRKEGFLQQGKEWKGRTGNLLSLWIINE